jgi:hypothetical protein
MVDSHTKSFFGQNTGIIVSSSSRSNPFTFMHCFKKKPSGIWEKPSSKEGKSIKFSLEELVLILRVLNHQTHKWQSQHTYRDTITSISFNWESEEAEVLWINIGKYSKRLNLAQTEILRLLLTHFLHEKVVFSTLPMKVPSNLKTNTSFPLEIKQVAEIQNFSAEDHFSNLDEPINKGFNLNEMSDIDGSIVGETDKAFLIKFDKIEDWVPKSAIKNHSNVQKNVSQKFLIDNWILKKLRLIP